MNDITLCTNTQEKINENTFEISKHIKTRCRLSINFFQEIILVLEFKISNKMNSLGTIAIPKVSKGIRTEIFAELLADSAAIDWFT